MKKIITTIIVIAMLTVPAIAAASVSNATTQYVYQQWSRQVRIRASLASVRITSTTIRCASLGGSYYTCWATYTGYLNGVHAKYGVYITITPTRWHTNSSPVEIGVW